MGQGKGGDGFDEPPGGGDDQDQAEDKEQMVDAGEDVFDAELQIGLADGKDAGFGGDGVGVLAGGHHGGLGVAVGPFDAQQHFNKALGEAGECDRGVGEAGFAAVQCPAGEQAGGGCDRSRHRGRRAVAGKDRVQGHGTAQSFVAKTQRWRRFPEGINGPGWLLGQFQVSRLEAMGLGGSGVNAQTEANEEGDAEPPQAEVRSGAEKCPHTNSSLIERGA